MRHISILILITFFLLLGSSNAQADDKKRLLTIDRVAEGQVQFDGIVDEPIWDDLEPLPMSVYQPIYGGEASEETEIYVSYDDNYLYVAGRMFTRNGGEIRSNSLYRDRYSGDDTFAIVLDTFNDNENAVLFFTNPAGVRFDFTIENDASQSRGFPGNDSWDTYWDVETSQDENGWYAEMRIPFSSLGFQNVGNQVEMGMIVYRYMAEKNERHMYPKVSQDFSFAYLKPSQAQDITVEGVVPRKPIYITPYLLGGRGFLNSLNDAETAYEKETLSLREMGLDLQTNITSNLALDLTVNTDFAQVEADDEQVNLTRFSLFFPEKRQFFQQRAGIFDFTLGRRDQLFYSRRIGIGDDGPLRILGGARMVGRIGEWDVGLIDMQTARDSENDVGSENFGVLRLRKKVMNDNSYAGGMLTSRIDEFGDYNVTWGADAIINTSNSDYLTLQFAQTSQEGFSETQEGFIPSSFVRGNFERRSNRGFNYSLTGVWAGKGFDPGVGFLQRNQYRNASARLSYGWYPEKGIFRRLSQSAFNSVTTRDEDGVIESVFMGSFTTFEFRNGNRLSVSARMNYEDLPESISLPFDNSVDIGTYWTPELDISYGMSRSQAMRFDAEMEVGGYYDGLIFTGGIGPAWTVSNQLELDAEYELNYIDLPEADPFDIHIGRLRVQASLNKNLSASTFLQYSNVSKDFTTNFRLRYNFSQGTDFWIVYNEGFNTDLRREQPWRPRSDTRSLLVKYTRSFAI